MTAMTLEQVRDRLRHIGDFVGEDGKGSYSAMADAIDAHLAKGAQEWQPIETAPRDGTRILLHRAGQGRWSNFVGAWSDHDRFWHDANSLFRDPTHWMPLPAAPMLSQRGEVEGG